MKKLLSVLLAVIMVFSTMTVLFSIPASAEVGTATAAAGGYLVNNGDGTLTAKPFYGNSFVGWFNADDEAVSYGATIGAVEEDVVAKFNNYNLIPNGSFEMPDVSAYSTDFNAETGAVTFEVKDAPGTNAGHGDKALYVDSSKLLSTAMSHALNLPKVTVKKNTTYVLRYSVFAETVEGTNAIHTTVLSDAAKALKEAEDKAYYNYDYACIFPQYSFKWGAEKADGTTPGYSGWCYFGNDNNTTAIPGPNTHFSVGVGYGKWIDVVFLFNTGEDASMFVEGEDAGDIWFNIGVGYDAKEQVDAGFGVGLDKTPNFYVDNISFTEVADTAKAEMTVVAGEGGTVTAPAANKGTFAMDLLATGGSAKGEADPAAYVVGNTAFAQMVTTDGVYTAKPAEGYSFDKWVDAAGNTLSTSAEAYLAGEGTVTALFKATGASADKGGYITEDGDALVAVPYYGNTFKGWYVEEEIVSSNNVYNGTAPAGLTAKFNVYNTVADGNFEVGDSADKFVYNAVVSGATVKDVPAGSHAVHGKKALYVATDGPTLSTAAHYAMRIPMNGLEKNTEYIVSFSYYLDGVANGGPEDAVSNSTSGIFQAYFQSETGFVNNWTAAGKLADWSIVWENEATDAAAIVPAAWRYKGNQNATMNASTHASVGTGIGKWVDVYIKINTGEDASIFAEGADTANAWFVVGNTYDDVNNKKDSSSNFYIDNIVVAKAAETEKAQTVTAGENGKVEFAPAPKAPVSLYSYATAGNAKGDAHDAHATGNLKYAQIIVTATTATAVPDEGYVFDGWYNGEDRISTSATDTFYGEEKVEARFIVDPNKAVNLITNGDFSEGGYKEATGNADKDTPIGWYDLSAQYANAKIHYPHTWDIAAGSLTNYSPSNVMGINSWQSAVQEIVLEAGKTYKVSAKMTMNAGTAIQSGRSISIGIDAGSGMEAHSLDFNKPWVARKNLEFSETTKKDGVTVQTWAGDFTDHSFIFNADDFIKANNITVGADGKFNARFVFVNDCTGWAEIDDVSIYEAFPIDVKVDNTDGVYGGYITGDTVGIKGKQVTIAAAPYFGNTFAGWYDADGALVSTDPSFTVDFEEGLSYTAKFNVENIWPDAGFENLGFNTNLLWNDGAEKGFGTWYSDTSSVYWHAVVSNERVASGNYALKLTHRNNPVSTPVIVEANTDYVLSFDWVIKTMTMGSNPEEQIPTYLDKVVIRDALGIIIAEYKLHTDNTGNFQNTEVYFNSGDNDMLFVTLCYYAGSDCIYLDNFALYEGAADEDFVKVTYNSDNETVGEFYEWVKTGTEYTVRKPDFQTPVAKKLLGYTYGEQTFDFADDVADVITVGTEDIVLTAYYEDFVSDKLSDETNFNPEDYDYTFVVLPDEQNVNERYPHYYSNITKWIVDNKDLYNIKGAISVGDITQGASLGEWSRAYEAYMLLEEAGIPFALTPGNHDYDFGVSHGTPNDNTVRRNDYLNFFFNRDTVDYSKYTTCPVTGDSLINSYYTVEAGTQKYLVMALEIFPRDEVLAWASDVLIAHPDHKAIVATHSHIFSDGSYATDYDKYPINYPEGSNSAEDVIEKFITKHENLVLYICGHSSKYEVLNIPVVGDNGNTVYQILADQQDADKNELGVGIVMLIGVNEAEGKFSFTTYSTLQDKYFMTESNEFDIYYNKQAAATPAAPTLAGKTETSVTLNAVDGYEYSMDGVTWQASPVFEGLTVATEYTFYQRVAETESSFASEKSEGLVVTTNDYPTPDAPAAPTVADVTETTVTLNAVDGYEYSMDGVTWQASPVFEGLTAATEYTFYQRVAATDTSYASEASEALVVTTDEEVVLLNGWVKEGSNWKFYKNNVAQKGWQKDGGKWYYLDLTTGYMVANKWMKDSKGWVFLGPDGAMKTNAWCTDSQGWCYVGADGYAVTNCWKKDSKGWIWLNANGSMTKNKWIEDGGKWYCLDANGYMVTNKWMKDSKGWCYLSASGAMATNAWVRDSIGWCYVGANGYAVTNCWKKDSTGWCYLNSNGSMVKNNWVQDGGKWYFLDKNGYMVTNKTVTISGKAYKFNASGVCLNP